MSRSLSLKLVFGLLVTAVAVPSPAQDWIRTGTGLGVERIRIAVPDFSATPDAEQLNKSFNAVLWNDLEQAGIFDMVSKSFYPLGQFGTPNQIQAAAWASPPPNASMFRTSTRTPAFFSIASLQTTLEVG